MKAARPRAAASDAAVTIPLNLLPATNAHLDRIRELHLAGLRDSGSLSLDPTLDTDLLDVERAYSDGLFLLAARADAPRGIVGMGALARIGDGYQIKRMRVDASQRRRGIAQAILARLIDEARARGIAELRLDTSLQQQAAQRLYERNGFVHERDLDIGGIPSRLYRLALAAPDTTDAR